MIPEWLTKNNNAIAHPHLPAWLANYRKLYLDAFLKTGLPTRHDERWKYTDLSFIANKSYSSAGRVDPNRLIDTIDQHRLQRGENILLVIVNGYFMPTLSDMHKLPREVIVRHFDQALETHAEIIKEALGDAAPAEQYPFANLNAAMSEDGLFFYLPKQYELAQPVHLLSITMDEDEFIAHPSHLFVLGEQSKLTLIEEHFSLASQSYLMNIVTSITVDTAATLEYYKIQTEGYQAVHLANTLIRQKQDSRVTMTQFSSGALFARDDVTVKLLGSGAECKTAGFYHLCRDNQYIDYHIDMDHVAPHSQSEMLYKGILDKKSCAVFNGRLHVAKAAQKIMAFQANHNLLLSNRAEIYSKPELEIYADDVKCKHGATIGQLDQDALFYMQSRGIEKDEATHILLQGFAEEIMHRISHPGVKLRMQETFMINNGDANSLVGESKGEG